VFLKRSTAGGTNTRRAKEFIASTTRRANIMDAESEPKTVQ
jgi:hypothetical protein